MYNYRIYGFYDECKRRYSIKLWKTFTDCFNCLPLGSHHTCTLSHPRSCSSPTFIIHCVHTHIILIAHTHGTQTYTHTVALVEEKILCMHGGLSPDLHDLNQVSHPLSLSLSLSPLLSSVSVVTVCVCVSADKRVGASTRSS